MRGRRGLVDEVVEGVAGVRDGRSLLAQGAMRRGGESPGRAAKQRLATCGLAALRHGPVWCISWSWARRAKPPRRALARPGFVFLYRRSLPSPVLAFWWDALQRLVVGDQLNIKVNSCCTSGVCMCVIVCARVGSALRLASIGCGIGLITQCVRVQVPLAAEWTPRIYPEPASNISSCTCPGGEADIGTIRKLAIDSGMTYPVGMLWNAWEQRWVELLEPRPRVVAGLVQRSRSA